MFFTFENETLRLFATSRFVYVIGIHATLDARSMSIDGSRINWTLGEFWTVFRRFWRVLGCS